MCVIEELIDYKLRRLSPLKVFHSCGMELWRGKLYEIALSSFVEDEEVLRKAFFKNFQVMEQKLIELLMVIRISVRVSLS